MKTAAARRTRALVLGLACLALATACRPYSVRRIAETKYPLRPPNYPIQLTSSDFREPYLEIAEVTTRGYDDRLIETAGPAELRRAARELGGDAVIHVSRDGVVQEEFTYRPGELTRRGTRFVNRYTLNGIVVRFIRGAGAQSATSPPPPAVPPQGEDQANPPNSP